MNDYQLLFDQLLAWFFAAHGSLTTANKLCNRKEAAVAQGWMVARARGLYEVAKVLHPDNDCWRL